MMKLWLFVLAIALGSVPLRAGGQATSVKITKVQNPSGTLRRAPLQLTVEVNSDAELANAQLVLTAPPGFALAALGAGYDTTHSQPSGAHPLLVFPLGTFKGVIRRMLMIGLSSADQQGGQFTILLDVLADSAGAKSKLVAEDTLNVTISPQITVALYLILGLVAVAIGYALRLVLKAFQTAAAPLPAPPQGAAAKGPITTFIEAHYYAVDFTVTLLLGFFALIALLKDGAPPDAGSRWYGAIGLGLSLGLLANSELITRVRPS